MQLVKLVTGAIALGAASAASAGTTVGIAAGVSAGSVVGDLLPIAGSGVLLLGAACLAFAIHLARRKRR